MIYNTYSIILSPLLRIRHYWAPDFSLLWLLLALAMAWRQGNLIVLLRKLKTEPFAMGNSAELRSAKTASTAEPSCIAANPAERAAKFGQLPYGVAIAAGTAVWIITVYG